LPKTVLPSRGSDLFGPAAARDHRFSCVRVVRRQPERRNARRDGPADAKLSRIPLISVTADPAWLQRAERAGVTRSIVRPVHLEDLLALVREYVPPRLR
jgi:hypothetical protein